MEMVEDEYLNYEELEMENEFETETQTNQPSGSSGCYKKQRKSFSMKDKLSTIMLVKPGVPGKSIRAIAKLQGLDESVVRGWMKNKEKIKNSVVGNSVKMRTSRQLPGAGRKAFYPEIEKELIKWVRERNQKGLRVKDKLIQSRAIALRNERLQELTSAVESTAMTETEIAQLSLFVVSHNWVCRFKIRHNLVSRRHTTSRILPEGFEKIATDFIRSVQNTIKEKNISPENTINFDQVPRYFELDHNSTITQKGSREVKLRKSSTNHKRFTFTPCITASGKVIGLHLLFSKLKKRPVVAKGCTVDVNGTGMWSETTIKCFIDEIIVKRAQVALFKPPTLVLLDAYAAHIKFVSMYANHYEKSNIFFKIIPGRLTGLLQPLDVALNRGFQQHFCNHLDAYTTNALGITDKRTKAGNIKIPSYMDVSEWIVDWGRQQTVDAVSKAFSVCGFVHPNDFNIEDLHRPLKRCFEDNFDSDVWMDEFPDVILDGADNTGWTFESEPEQSFYKILYRHTVTEDDFDTWYADFINDIKTLIEGDAELFELFDEEEKNRMNVGLITESKIDILYMIFSSKNNKRKNNCD